MPWSLLSLSLVLLVLGMWLVLVTIAVMAWSLLRPPRMTDGKAAWLLRRLSPGDLSLPYEDVSFDVRDEHTGGTLRIAGWWIPGEGTPARETGRCVVLIHGYADAKVGAIAWAPLWHARGYNVLAIDLRAHGESGGNESTGGYYERHDVDQVISQLRAERPASTRRVVLFGASLGAAVAAAVATLRDDLAAVVLESPYLDFRSASMTHMDLLGLPGPRMQRAALHLAEWLGQARFDAVRPVDLVHAVRCPILLVAPANDIFLRDDAVRVFETALAARQAESGPGYVWLVEGATHLLGVHANPNAYGDRLNQFLAETLDASRAAPGAAESECVRRGADAAETDAEKIKAAGQAGS
jgi:alpha-beta hydrolase superfamily lysophospholipase